MIPFAVGIKSTASYPFCTDKAIYSPGAEAWGWEDGKSCHVSLTQQSGDTAGSDVDPTKEDPVFAAKVVEATDAIKAKSTEKAPAKPVVIDPETKVSAALL